MPATFMTPKKSATPAPSELSKREREVMDILHRRGEATVAEIMADMADPPTYSAVRSVLRILGEKALIRYKEDGPRYVYQPAQDTETARTDVLAHVVRTYFAGSAEQAMTALLRMSDVDMSDAEIARLRATIRRARQSED
ncbi:MAG TPA: BlaI/MecI/CopY family transcriptional regulator [Gemmatimonadaceae bacterium]|jgi:predicted transcriptional regulator